MIMKKPEALRLAHLLESDCWADAALELRRLHTANTYCMDWYESASQEIVNLHARVQELENQLKSIGAVGAKEMVPVGWAISYDGKTPYALWTEGDGALLDLEIKSQGGTTCKMELYARIKK